MSKICGLLDPASSEEDLKRRLRSMAKAIKHHPDLPEQFHFFEGGGISLIGNLSSPEEERWARDERSGSRLGLCGSVVGFEGDADLLLRAFEERGEDLLSELNGAFAFAHYDPAARTFTVVNDRYGLMPLYYCQEQGNGSFLFASEAKAILRVLGSRKIDWQSVADFFYAGHMTGQKTLFEGVHAMVPGQRLAYRDRIVEKSKYYDFTRMPLLSPENVSTEKLATLFLEAVRRRIREDVPNTVLLSGGFDSRLVLGAMRMLGVRPKVVSLEHAELSQGADGRFASLIADRLGLECDLRRTREGLFSSEDILEVFYILDGMVPTWGLHGRRLFISEVYPELDGAMGAVWDGLILDDALGGPRHGYEFRESLKEFAGDRGVNRPLLGLILTPRKFLAANRGFMRRLHGELAKSPPSENRFRYFVLEQRMRRRIAANPYQLYSAKVEPVTPGTDADFMDYAYSIPDGLKTNYRLYIEMLRRHFPILAEVPIFSGNSLFCFDGNELGRQHARVPAPRERLKKRLRQMWGRASKALGAVGVPGARHRTRTDEHGSASLVISVLQQKNFDRPIYNKWLLRRLFAAYRAGNGTYHKLFVIVFYIELWHLLFVDEDSPVLFNPRDLRT
jgi:Glutamine amidotransferase domain/Asparagine synthase